MVKRIFGRWSEKRRFFDYRLKKVDRKADYVFGRDPLWLVFKWLAKIFYYLNSQTFGSKII
jgi:hypothetical protein